MQQSKLELTVKHFELISTFTCQQKICVGNKNAEKVFSSGRGAGGGGAAHGHPAALRLHPQRGLGPPRLGRQVSCLAFVLLQILLVSQQKHSMCKNTLES